MTAPPSKRYRKGSDTMDYETLSDFDTSGPIFPSDEEDDETDDRLYPSEDSNQTENQTVIQVSDNENDRVFPSEESNEAMLNDTTLTMVEELREEDRVSISSLSDSGTEGEDEDEQSELQQIGSILVGKCCKNCCLHYLTAVDVIQSRKEMYQHTKRSDQKRWLHRKLSDSSSQASDGTFETKYYISGKNVCLLAYCKVYSLSIRTLKRLLQKITFSSSLHHGNAGKKRQNTRTEAAVAWMKRYFFLVGDKMPDRCQIHLPCWETRKDVYSRYCTDMGNESTEDLLKISMFYKVWNNYFANVRIPEVGYRVCSKYVICFIL